MKSQKESQIVEVVNMLLKKKHFSGSTNQTSSLFTFQKKKKTDDFGAALRNGWPPSTREHSGRFLTRFSFKCSLCQLFNSPSCAQCDRLAG